MSVLKENTEAGPSNNFKSGYFGYGVKDQRDIFPYNSSYQAVTAKQIKSKK